MIACSNWLEATFKTDIHFRADVSSELNSDRKINFGACTGTNNDKRLTMEHRESPASGSHTLARIAGAL
jgi:hypothetical protein